jgi:small multidrug resistance family-3 protein
MTRDVRAGTSMTGFAAAPWQFSKTLQCSHMLIIRTACLFVLTAVAEIIGCYLPYLWLRKDGSPWLLVPAVASLAAFAWLLTLHPTAAGRVYAAYGGVYICVAILWLWAVEGQKPSSWDLLGALVALVGMAIIMFGPPRTT